MNKREYIEPHCKVRNIYGDDVMQGFAVLTSDGKSADTSNPKEPDPNTPHYSKINITFEDGQAGGYNIWEDE